MSLGKDRIRRIDFSGGDPLGSDEDIDIILNAQSILGKDKVSVTTTGEGIAYAKSNHSEYIHDLLANCEITIDEIDDNKEYKRKEGNYYNKNMALIKQNEQAISRLVVNVPILRPDMDSEAVRRLVDRINKLKVANKSCTLIRLMKTGKMVKDYPANYDPRPFIECFLQHAKEVGLKVHVQCALRGPCNQEPSCTMLYEKIGIDCSGNVFACAWGGYVIEPPEKNPFYLGNIYKENLDSILRSENAITMKDKLNGCSSHCKVFNYFGNPDGNIYLDCDSLCKGEKT